MNWACPQEGDKREVVSCTFDSAFDDKTELIFQTKFTLNEHNRFRPVREMKVRDTMALLYFIIKQNSANPTT